VNRIITYAINQEDGLVISRVGSELAWPVLQWDAMTPENNFETSYQLESVRVLSVGTEYSALKWTKKIPIDLKNKHRAFWGMKPLEVQS
jgi:hypothetical protein